MPKARGDHRYQLLAELRFASMPATFDAHNDIECIYVLSSGKLVEATLPTVEFRREGPRYAGPATVEKLTTLGRQLAEKYERGRACRP